MTTAGTLDRTAVVAFSIIGVAALVVIAVADQVSLRVAMMPVVVSSALGIALAVHRIRQRR